MKGKTVSDRAGFAQHTEHIFLVGLHAGLVEGVDAGHVAGDGAGHLKEADQSGKALLVALGHFDDDVGHTAGDVGVLHRVGGDAVDLRQVQAGDVVQPVGIGLFKGDGKAVSGRCLHLPEGRGGEEAGQGGDALMQQGAGA